MRRGGPTEGERGRPREGEEGRAEGGGGGVGVREELVAVDGARAILVDLVDELDAHAAFDEARDGALHLELHHDARELGRL